MHGVNLDQLGRRDPLLYGTLTLPELERQIEQDARARWLRRTLLPHQPRRRVHRASALPARQRRRDPAEPRLLDALRVGDPRRARDRRPAGAGDPPVRHRAPRAVAPFLGDPRPVLRDDLRTRAGRLPGRAHALREHLDRQAHERGRSPDRRAPAQRERASAWRPAARARARRAAGRRADQPPLPDRFHRQQRRSR